MTRLAILVWSLMMTVPAIAQQTQDSTMPYQMPAPEKWGKETIPLPPDFAPDMKWEGLEELRFAPNFLKPDSATFFSYALLFWLPDTVKLDVGTMERELLVYYRGLAKAVSSDSLDVTGFTMTVKDDTTKHAKRPTGEEVSASLGELNWIEPFTTRKAQTLRMEIQIWDPPNVNGKGVFICASPQPQTAAIWKSLRDIREGCVLKIGSVDAPAKP